jgi:hypothetical protein
MSTESIFVSIACLSDPDIILTIKDAIKKALHPEKLSFGVCLQILEDDKNFAELKNLSCVRIKQVSVYDAKGPIYARYICEKLLESETYFLQIDCHTRFFQNWDQIIIDEFKKSLFLNQKALLSYYPINTTNKFDKRISKRIGHINRFRYLGSDSIKSHGSLIDLPKLPIKSIGICGAMLFMRSIDRKKYGYDPNLDFGLHAAEQVLYAIRLWTNGFDIFCPTRHILSTEYLTNRDRIPVKVKEIHSRNRKDWPEATWTKVKFILGLDSEKQIDHRYKKSIQNTLANYSFGSSRSLLDYYKFAKIHEKLKDIFPDYIYRDVS